METEVSRFVFLNPPGVLEGILIFLLYVLVSYAAVKSTRRMYSLWKRITLISLSLASFTLIVFILLNPALRLESYREEKPRLAILVDYSWSMNLSGSDSRVSRIQAVRDFLNSHSDFVSKIQKSFAVNYYVFDKALFPVSSDFISSNEPAGKDTDIPNAVSQLSEEHNTEKPDSVILFSDGADGSRFLKKAADIAVKTDFPINTISTSGAGKDVWIDNVLASNVAFLKYPMSIDVLIKSAGFKNITFPVTLTEGDKIVSVQEVTIPADSSDVKVGFTITPKSLQRTVYTVSIPHISGESIEENNKKSFVVNVIVDKIRILHVAGNPSWDVRFLRKALKGNPNIDLVAFFILREETDLVFASQNELSLIPFPVDEIFEKELDTFDVVIFQNFDFQPYGIYGYHLRNLRDYVMEKGGAFMMVGGDKSFNGGSYAETPISDILPVELGFQRSGEISAPNGFSTKLTETGSRHPVMKIIPNRMDNDKEWEEMPPIEGMNKVDRLKPSAIPLLTTAEGAPVFVLNQPGSGKVASLLTDSSWKWSFVRGGEGEVSPYYEKFWNRLILWLVNDPSLKDVRVTTDKTSYSVGERPRLSISAFDIDEADNAGSELKSSVILPSCKTEELSLEKNSDDSYSAEIEPKELGIYKVGASSGDDTNNEPVNGDETVFVVEPPRNEVRGPTANEDLLKALAEKSGGHYMTVKENPSKLGLDFSPKKTITGYKTVRIWDRFWVFVALVGLVSSEWILRRRWGLK